MTKYRDYSQQDSAMQDFTSAMETAITSGQTVLHSTLYNLRQHLDEDVNREGFPLSVLTENDMKVALRMSQNLRTLGRISVRF